MYAIRIRLKNLDNYSVEYIVNRSDYGWESNYVADGDMAGKQSINSKIVGIKVRIVPKVKREPQLIYRGYIDKQGYQRTYAKGDLLAGTEGEAGLNGLKISLLYAPKEASIEYQVLTDDKNGGRVWNDWVKDGELAGNEQNGKNMYAIRIRLKNLDDYSVEYNVYRKNKGWENSYVSDGETIGLEYSDSILEGIKIRIVPKKNKGAGVAYSGYLEKTGFQERVGSGGVLGTQGNGLGLNSFRIELRHLPQNVGIKYQGFIKNSGWQNIKNEGEYAGANQNGKNLCGVKIELTNTDEYSIQYRIYRHNFGWESWVSDGDIAGNEDNSGIIEGIQIKIVENRHLVINTSKYPGYKEKIESLMNAHPNWNFELLYTGLNFEDVTSGECQLHSRNLIPSSYSGEWICPTCGTKLYDSGLYCASEKAVAYYMDPRNFLDENNIFQFEKLNMYESSIHTIDGIRNKVNGTFLNDYANDINTACRNKNVNPYYIVARLLQEQGRNGTKIGKGMDGGNGKTYYNPFNIGASGNGYTQIYNNALKTAKSYGWDTMEKALEGGIDFCKKNWLENYQNTLYQNKFDIDTRNGTSLYNHQYMQNLLGAYSEAKTLKSMYSQTNCLDGNFTFIIPVYENMSASASPVPTNNSESYSLNVRVNANGGLKLRSEANTNSDTIEVIPNGTVLLSVQRGINDNWNKVITTDGKIGFMSGNYLQIIDTIKNCDYTACVKTNDGSGCKVRIGPSINLDRLTTLSEGTAVNVVEKGTFNNINGYDWCRIITHDGRQGYMPLKYLN